MNETIIIFLAGVNIVLLIIAIIEIRTARREAQEYLDAIGEMLSDNLENMKRK